MHNKSKKSSKTIARISEIKLIKQIRKALNKVPQMTSGFFPTPLIYTKPDSLEKEEI